MVDIYHGKGIDKNKDLVNICETLGIISKKGAWLNYGKNKWQGVSSAVEQLQTDEKLREELYEKAIAAKPVEEKESED
jgi:hypothetical protein